MKMKCCRCKKQLEMDNFYKRIQSPTGYTPACKKCLKKDHEIYCKKEKEKRDWTAMFIGG